MSPVQRGSLAQLVEQRPEEPCVPSSSLGGATKIKYSSLSRVFYFGLSLLNRLELGSSCSEYGNSCLRVSLLSGGGAADSSGRSHHSINMLVSNLATRASS
jgi:hypothetical protein